MWSKKWITQSRNYYIMSSITAKKLYVAKSFTKERNILQSIGVLSKSTITKRVAFMGNQPQKVYQIIINELDKYRNN